MEMDFKILPKWWHLTKSDHTDRHSLVVVEPPKVTYLKIKFQK